jgi:deoxyhypusine synthase
VPIYTVVARRLVDRHERRRQALEGNKLRLDVNADVNETASIVLDAKRAAARAAC